jgi:hypothetical protein
MDDPGNTIFPAPNRDEASVKLPDASPASVHAAANEAAHGDLPYTRLPVPACESAAPHPESFRARAHAPVSPVPSRRAALLAAGLAALTLVAWLVVQREGLLDAVGPREIVRAQLDDLGRGQLRAAYELFSPRYRQEVPFNEWRELVVTHWRVFRTRELRFGDNQEYGGRTVMETHLTAESGDHYVARFTLIRADGRWWVDDLRWSHEGDDQGRIST